jgi:hypothetical protein
VTPRQAVRVERPFEGLIDETIEMLQPVTDRPPLRFHLWHSSMLVEDVRPR